MALADIDAGATRRHIQEIADGARAAFEAHAQRSAEIDAASREAVAKEEADLEAVRERRAEARKAAEQSTPAAAEPAAREVPRPSRTLKLGARDDDVDTPPQDTPERDEPVRKRPPRPEADDDLSGRTWLR